MTEGRPTVHVRTLTDDDLDAAWELTCLAFGEKKDDVEQEAEQSHLDPARMHGAFDGEQMVGVIAGLEFEMTVPGGPSGTASLPCAGTTWVAVAPTHRRRGVLRALMSAHLRFVADAGEPFAALWASEAPIYPRFAYGRASDHVTLTADVRGGIEFRDDAPPALDVRLVPRTEARGVIEPLYESARSRRAGMHTRADSWWTHNALSTRPGAMSGMNQKHVAVASLEGRDVGYAIYGMKNDFADWRPEGILTVKELIGLDPAAEVGLWRYLLQHDLVASVVAPLRPTDDVLPHVLADPRLVTRRPYDGLYVRLIDLPAALQGRGYTASAEVTIEVQDDAFAANATIWRLRLGPRGGDVQAASESPGRAQLAMDVRVLGACYLGATDLRTLAAAGQVDVRDPSALTALAVALRHHVAPFGPEIW